MDRLSGLDASFLYLETPAQLMHVCAVIVLDPDTMPGGYDFETFQAELGRRVNDVPTFTKKLRRVPMGLDHPIWVKDRQFDIERHVHRLALPAPGGYAELVKLTSHLAGLPLDRSRPLWEMWIIEGYDDGKIVCFSKMHHATVDGVSGSNLISHLCALEPDAEPLVPSDTPQHGREASSRELLGRAVVSRLSLPVAAARLVAPTAETVTRTIGRARAGTAMAAPLTAPRTSFNGTITSHRSIASGQPQPRRHPRRQECNRHYGQRRRAGGQRRSPARLPRGARRAARHLLARLGAGQRARLVEAVGGSQQGLLAVREARHRHRRPARASGRHGRAQQERPRAPQRDQRRLAAGLGRVRGTAHLRPRRPCLRRVQARREAPRRAQPGHLERAGTAGAALLPGREDRGAVPARPGVPRRRAQRDGDEQQRSDERRHHRLS